MPEKIASMEEILALWQEAISQNTANEPLPPDELINHVPPIVLEVSKHLTPFVDNSNPTGQRFFEQLPLMKEGIFRELGVTLPEIVVRGYTADLPDGSFVVKLNELHVGKGYVDPKRILVNASPENMAEWDIEAEETTMPSKGEVASWISILKREQVEEAGYTCWDAQEYIILFLSTILRKKAHLFVGVEEVQAILDKLYNQHHQLISTVTPSPLELSKLTEILRRLVEEEISILDMKSILRSLSYWSRFTQDEALLTESVRIDQRTYITQKYAHNDTLFTYLVETQIEEVIRDAAIDEEGPTYLDLDPALAEEILDATRRVLKEEPIHPPWCPIVLTQSDTRRHLKQLLMIDFPEIVVLSFQEIDTEFKDKITPLARISLQDKLPSDPLRSLRKWGKRLPKRVRRRLGQVGAGPYQTLRSLAEQAQELAEQVQEFNPFATKEPKATDAPTPTQEPAQEAPPEEARDRDLWEEVRQQARAEEAEKTKASEVLEQANRAETIDPPEAKAPKGPKEADAPKHQAVTEPPIEEPDKAKDQEASGTTEGAEESEEAATPENSLAYIDQWEYLQERMTWLKMYVLTCHIHKRDKLAPFQLTNQELSSMLGESIWRIQHIPSLDKKGLNKARQMLAHRIQARIKETHRQGGELALERLKQSFRLTPQDEQILLLSLLYVYEPYCGWLQHKYLPVRNTMELNIRLTMDLLSSDDREQNQLLQRFQPKAPLRQHKLLSMSGKHAYLSQGFEDQSFAIDADVLFRLTATQEEESTTSSPLPTETLLTLDLPLEVKESVQELLARFLAEQGPGDGPQDNEPLEQLYVFEGDGQPSWKEVFTKGLVLLFHESKAKQSHLEATTGRGLSPLNLSQPDTKADGEPSIMARHMSAALRRRIQHIQPDALPEGEQQESVRKIFRQARLKRSSVLIEPDTGDKKAREVLIQEVADFGGVSFWTGWQGPAPTSWQDKVVMQMTVERTENGADSWKLTQLMGPTVLRQTTQQGLKDLEEQLALRIVGQESALQRISQIVRTAKAHLDARPERPDGVFLLAGPSGTGKTETAIALNDALYGTKDTFLRLDMSEFHFRESISSLIGTTAGFVGYNDGGRLTNFIRQHPESVVLLDEIEKAHPLVLDLFLQVFDAGHLTDGKGHHLDLSRTTFLLTTNIGAETFQENKKLGFVKEIDREQRVEIVLGQLRKRLRPEFFNRFDEVLVFYPLDTAQLIQLCQKEMRQLQERFARRGLWLSFAPELASYIVNASPHDQGARGIIRMIEKTLSLPLTEFILAHEDAQNITARVNKGEILIEKA